MNNNIKTINFVGLDSAKSRAQHKRKVLMFNLLLWVLTIGALTIFWGRL